MPEPCPPVMVASTERMLGGVLFLVEVAFCADHAVYQRTLWMREPEEGWLTKMDWGQVGKDSQLASWGDKTTLEVLAKRMASRGWRIAWN